MKRENVNYFYVGLVVLVALGLFLAALMVITGRSGPTDRYVVRYSNVAGLGFGTAVYYQGFRIGQVETVTPEQKDGKTKFLVDFSITKGWQVPQDSVAQQLSSGLLSDVFIGILEGSEATLLKPGDEIAGVEGGDLFAAVGELAGEVTTLTRRKIAPLFDKIGRGLDGISDRLESQGPRLVDQATKLMDQLVEGSDRINAMLGKRNQDNLASTLEGASGTAQNLQALSNDLKQTRQQLDVLLAEAGAVVSENRPEVGAAMADLRVTLSALSQRIDAITYNLESASRNFDELSRELRRTPNRLLFSPPADALKDKK